MGFTPQRTIYKLRFEDLEYDGLLVRMTGSSLGETLDSMALADASMKVAALQKQAEDASTPERQAALLDAAREQCDRVTRFYETFAAHLVDWNVEDLIGEPVPPTFDGVKTQELGFILAIMNAWRAGVQEVPSDIKAPSSSGSNALEVSLPMDISSPSHPNSPAPSSSSATANDSGASPVSS